MSSDGVILTVCEDDIIVVLESGFQQHAMFQNMNDELWEHEWWMMENANTALCQWFSARLQ